MRPKAWEQFNHLVTILKQLSLQTKHAKSKFTAQIQQWLGELHDTKLQWLSSFLKKVIKYATELDQLKTKKRSEKNTLPIPHIFPPSKRENSAKLAKGNVGLLTHFFHYTKRISLANS